MDVRCLKVNELHKEPCSLDTRSLKAELAERLLAALEAKEPEEEWELEADDVPTNRANRSYLGTTRGRSELEGTEQPPLPRPHPHPEPCSYSGPDGHYVMDNIIRQNQFYKTPVIKQENESGYDRRPLVMEPQQQAYHPELKKEMKQEAPPSSPPSPNLTAQDRQTTTPESKESF